MLFKKWFHDTGGKGRGWQNGVELLWHASTTVGTKEPVGGQCQGQGGVQQPGAQEGPAAPALCCPTSLTQSNNNVSLE